MLWERELLGTVSRVVLVETTRMNAPQLLPEPDWLKVQRNTEYLTLPIPWLATA